MLAFCAAPDPKAVGNEEGGSTDSRPSAFRKQNESACSVKTTNWHVLWVRKFGNRGRHESYLRPCGL